MNQKGVTLLLAVLVSSIALSVGIGIFSLLLGEITISGTAKDSVTAFYAAESGFECAIYWESREVKDSDFINPFVKGGSDIEIRCNDVPYIVGDSTCAGDCTAEFFPEYAGGASEANSCAHIVVEKEDMGGGYIQTRINSDGENRDQCNIAPTSLRTLQQSLELKY